jgi:hypothetical protein
MPNFSQMLMNSVAKQEKAKAGINIKKKELQQHGGAFTEKDAADIKLQIKESNKNKNVSIIDNPQAQKAKDFSSKEKLKRFINFKI